MSPQRIRVGHSPDPDDAFMFYALAHDKLDTGGSNQDIPQMNPIHRYHIFQVDLTMRF